jgi:hypothetical protein
MNSLSLSILSLNTPALNLERLPDTINMIARVVVVVCSIHAARDVLVAAISAF